MSLNNKGFAISGVLYSLLILFVTLFIGILTIFATTKFSFDKVKNDIISKLEPKTLKDIVTTSDENPSIPDCVTNNTECSAGTCMAIKVSDGDTYNFCVMSEDTENNKITLLMDRNLGEDVFWISEKDYLEVGGTEDDYGTDGNNNKGPVTTLKALEERTSNWTNIPLETYQVIDENNIYSPITRTARARLITYTEASNLLSLENNSWVYGNLNYSSSPYGYWISSAPGYFHSAYYMHSNGWINWRFIKHNTYGIRPVITLKKS